MKTYGAVDTAVCQVLYDVTGEAGGDAVDWSIYLAVEWAVDSAAARAVSHSVYGVVGWVVYKANTIPNHWNEWG